MRPGSGDCHIAERALLLAALRPDESTFSTLLACSGEFSLDWGWMLARAKAHKVSALLASRVLSEDSGPARSDEITETLQEAMQEARQRHAAAAQTLTAVAAHLRGAGVPFLLVKGELLTKWLYDDPGRRRFYDLDLVVRPAHVDAAVRALTGLGYRASGHSELLGVQPENNMQSATAAAVARRLSPYFHHEIDLVSVDKSFLPVDLHWHIVPPGLSSLSAEGLWRYAVDTEVAGVAVSTLDHEATFLHLVMHALAPWRSSFRLLHVCDVGWALVRLPLDFARLESLARAWKVRGYLARVLFVVENLFEQQIPTSLRTWVGAAPLRPLLARTFTPTMMVDHAGKSTAAPTSGLRGELAWAMAVGSLRNTTLHHLGKNSGRLLYHWQTRRHYRPA